MVYSKSLTGWTKVDRTVIEIRLRPERASTEEQFQAVGLPCREALISLAQTVFDARKHPTLDQVTASNTDAKRMPEAYLAVELSGGEQKIARQHAKAALDLANELQHKRTAVFRQAALCAEATSAVVNLIAIVSGQRDPYQLSMEMANTFAFTDVHMGYTLLDGCQMCKRIG